MIRAHRIFISVFCLLFLFIADLSASQDIIDDIIDGKYPGQVAGSDQVTITKMHTMVSGMQDKLIFDVTLIFNNKGNIFSSREGLFSFDSSCGSDFAFIVTKDAVLLNSSHEAVIKDGILYWKDGLAPSQNKYSFSYKVPYNYKNSYEYLISPIFYIDNLIVVVDSSFDVNTDVNSVERKVRNIANDANVAYIIGSDITNELLIKISPIVKSENYYIKEIMLGILLGLIVLFIKKMKKKPSSSHRYLMKNIATHEQYDRTL